MKRLMIALGLCLLTINPAISQRAGIGKPQDVIIPGKNVDEVIGLLERRKVLELEVVNQREQIKSLREQIRSLDEQTISLQKQLISFRQSEYAWGLERQSLEDQLKETQKRLRRLRWQKGILIGGAVAYVVARVVLPRVL